MKKSVLTISNRQDIDLMLASYEDHFHSSECADHFVALELRMQAIRKLPRVIRALYCMSSVLLRYHRNIALQEYLDEVQPYPRY